MKRAWWVLNTCALISEAREGPREAPGNSLKPPGLESQQQSAPHPLHESHRASLLPQGLSGKLGGFAVQAAPTLPPFGASLDFCDCASSSRLLLTSVSPLQYPSVGECGSPWALCPAMQELCLAVSEENGPLSLVSFSVATEPAWPPLSRPSGVWVLTGPFLRARVISSTHTSPSEWTFCSRGTRNLAVQSETQGHEPVRGLSSACPVFLCWFPYT